MLIGNNYYIFNFYCKLNKNVLNILKKKFNRELSEPLELQLDYWLTPNKATRNEVMSKRVDTKFTLKASFKSLHISRLFLTNEEPLTFFTVSYIKEKKQKSKLLIIYVLILYCKFE